MIPQCATDKRGKESFRNNKTKDARLECDWVILLFPLAFHYPPNCLSTTLDLGDISAFQKCLKEARRGLPLRSNIYQVNENDARFLYSALKVARFPCGHGCIYTKTNWLPAGARGSVYLDIPRSFFKKPKHVSLHTHPVHVHTSRCPESRQNRRRG